VAFFRIGLIQEIRIRHSQFGIICKLPLKFDLNPSTIARLEWEQKLDRETFPLYHPMEMAGMNLIKEFRGMIITDCLRTRAEFIGCIRDLEFSPVKAVPDRSGNFQPA